MPETVLPSPERAGPETEGGLAGLEGKSDIMPCNLFLWFSEPRKGRHKTSSKAEGCKVERVRQVTHGGGERQASVFRYTTHARFQKGFLGRVGNQSRGTRDGSLCNVDASRRKVACMLVALSHDLGNTSQVHPQDTEMAATSVQRFTERQLVKQDRETGGWEKTLVLFTGDTMRSNR